MNWLLVNLPPVNRAATRQSFSHSIQYGYAAVSGQHIVIRWPSVLIQSLLTNLLGGSFSLLQPPQGYKKATEITSGSVYVREAAVLSSSEVCTSLQCYIELITVRLHSNTAKALTCLIPGT